MGSYIDSLMLEAKKKAGPAPLGDRSIFLPEITVSGPVSPIDRIGIDITKPSQIQEGPIYDDENEGPLSEYVGNLFSLLGDALVPDYSPFSKEARARSDRFIEEDIPAAGKKLKQGFDRAMTSLSQLNYFVPGAPERMAEYGSKVIEEAKSVTGGLASGIASNPSKVMGQLFRGLLEMTVEPLLTISTEKKIVGDEILDATVEEAGSALLGAAALPISAGVYTKLAGVSKGAVASSAFRDMSPQKLGLIARSVGKEYVAQSAASLVQEGLTNPEDISIEMISRNIANPVILGLSAAVGPLKYYTATNKNRKLWMDNSAIINNDVMTVMPSAKQVAVDQMSSLGDGLAALDALTTADDWIAAGLKKIKKDQNSVYILPGLGAEKADELLSKYKGEVPFVKPDIKGLPEGITPKSKRGTTLYFENKFDQYVATSGKSIGELAEEFKLPRNQVEAIMMNVAKKLKETETLNASGFKYKRIEDVPLPLPEPSLKSYKSINNDVLMTYKELTGEQIGQFRKTGYMLNETVSYLGKNTKIEKFTKNFDKVLIRPNGGKIKWVSIDDINRIPNGDKTIWNKTAYDLSMADEFLNFANRDHNKHSFLDLIERFVDEKVRKLGWDPNGANEKFTQFLYAKLNDDIVGNQQMFERLDDALFEEASSIQNRVTNRLNAHGYRVEPVGAGYKVIDIDGNDIGRFMTLEQVNQFALADFQNLNIPDLMAKATAPVQLVDVLPVKSEFGKKVDQQIQRFFLSKNLIEGSWFRRADRRTMDLAKISVKQGFESLDNPAGRILGVRITDLYDDMANSIDAWTQGAAKSTVKKLEQATKDAKDISLSRRAEITKALEQKSPAEQRAIMSNEEIANAEMIFAITSKAGGIEKVKQTLFDIRNKTSGKKLKVKSIEDPILAEAVVMLDKAVKQGILSDERILRYVDILDSGENLTAAEYIANQNWGDKERKLYSTLKEFYDEGSSLFKIDRTISGYSPHIQKWENLKKTYKDVPLETEFIHELRRIGITPGEMLLTDPIELAHRYLKSGIHHKAPTPDGRTAGEVLSEINKSINELAEMGANVKPIQQWIDNIRGVPDIETSAANTYNQAAEKVFNKKFKEAAKRAGIDVLMDFQSLMKLGAVPFMAFRDLVGTGALALTRGEKALFELYNFSTARVKRIEGLSAAGELPQFSGDAMLSRMGRTKLSKATDIGLKLSGQQQTYRLFLGNMYIHTYDTATRVLNKSGGDLRKVVDELGDLLDSNPRDIQEYFLANVNTDPINAIRFLSRSNAYAIANKFGRLNNPLAWQGQFGRAFGQFGSWSLNALTTIGESLNNSRSKQAAAMKLAKMAAFSTAAYYGSAAVGLNPVYYILNPLTLVPGGGPVLDAYFNAHQGLQMSQSGDERVKARGVGILSRTLEDFITPSMWKNLQESAESMEKDGEFFKAAMIAAGFKFKEEE